MPLALIHRDPRVLNDHYLEQLVERLPEMIANALSVEGDPSATLKANEVEIRVSDRGPFDKNTRPLGITIFANFYPKRAENLDDRVERFQKWIKTVLPPGFFDGVPRLGYVWILLGHGEYAEF